MTTARPGHDRGLHPALAQRRRPRRAISCPPCIPTRCRRGGRAARRDVLFHMSCLRFRLIASAAPRWPGPRGVPRTETTRSRRWLRPDRGGSILPSPCDGSGLTRGQAGEQRAEPAPRERADRSAPIVRRPRRNMQLHPKTIARRDLGPMSPDGCGVAKPSRGRHAGASSSPRGAPFSSRRTGERGREAGGATPNAATLRRCREHGRRSPARRACPCCALKALSAAAARTSSAGTIRCVMASIGTCRRLKAASPRRRRIGRTDGHRRARAIR